MDRLSTDRLSPPAFNGAIALPPLPIVRYIVRLRAATSASLPGFLGSTLRGAFGHALKEAVCLIEDGDCVRCLASDRCLYPYLFETPFPNTLPQMQSQECAPHPFILLPPVFTANPAQIVERREFQPGGRLEFGLTLIGPAIEHLRYVILAIREMARQGLGVERARFELADVLAVETEGLSSSIYSGTPRRVDRQGSVTRSLVQWVEDRLALLPKNDRITLRFRTPTRVRVGGDLQPELTFELLVRNLLRRISMLAAVHGDERFEADFAGIIARAKAVKTTALSVPWYDWERYSNRQKTKMNLGGFTGEIAYSGDVNEFLPLLAAGEILHVGGSTSFGLGKFEIHA